MNCYIYDYINTYKLCFIYRCWEGVYVALVMLVLAAQSSFRLTQWFTQLSMIHIVWDRQELSTNLLPGMSKKPRLD